MGKKADPVVRETYFRLTQAVYRRWQPEKLGNVPNMMQKYADQEDEVYDKALRLYVFNQDRSVWQPLIEGMYKRFHPEKLEDLDQVLKKYEGDEAKLFKALCDKYIPTLKTGQKPLELPAWGEEKAPEKKAEAGHDHDREAAAATGGAAHEAASESGPPQPRQPDQSVAAKPSAAANGEQQRPSHTITQADSESGASSSPRPRAPSGKRKAVRGSEGKPQPQPAATRPRSAKRPRLAVQETPRVPRPSAAQSVRQDRSRSRTRPVASVSKEQGRGERRPSRLLVEPRRSRSQRSQQRKSGQLQLDGRSPRRRSPGRGESCRPRTARLTSPAAATRRQDRTDLQPKGRPRRASPPLAEGRDRQDKDRPRVELVARGEIPAGGPSSRRAERPDQAYEYRRRRSPSSRAKTRTRPRSFTRGLGTAAARAATPQQDSAQRHGPGQRRSPRTHGRHFSREPKKDRVDSEALQQRVGPKQRQKQKHIPASAAPSPGTRRVDGRDTTGRRVSSPTKQRDPAQNPRPQPQAPAAVHVEKVEDPPRPKQRPDKSAKEDDQADPKQQRQKEERAERATAEVSQEACVDGSNPTPAVGPTTTTDRELELAGTGDQQQDLGTAAPSSPNDERSPSTRSETPASAPEEVVGTLVEPPKTHDDTAASNELLSAEALQAFREAVPQLDVDGKHQSKPIKALVEYGGQALEFEIRETTTLSEVARMYTAWIRVQCSAAAASPCGAQTALAA